MEITEIRYVLNRDRPYDRRPSMSRIYFWPEESAVENLENRRTRPYIEYKKLIPYVLEMAQIGHFRFFHNVTARWSQKAGCACGCSPGFILDGRLVPVSLGVFGTYDIHVTIK